MCAHVCSAVASVASAHDRLVKNFSVFDSLLAPAVQTSRPKTRLVCIKANERSHAHNIDVHVIV